MASRLECQCASYIRSYVVPCCGQLPEGSEHVSQRDRLADAEEMGCFAAEFIQQGLNHPIASDDNLIGYIREAHIQFEKVQGLAFDLVFLAYRIDQYSG